MENNKLLEVHAFRRDEGNDKQSTETLFTNAKGLDADLFAHIIKNFSPQEEIPSVYYGHDFYLGNQEYEYGFVELGAVVAINSDSYNPVMLSNHDDVMDLLYAMTSPDMSEEEFYNLSMSEIVGLIPDKDTVLSEKLDSALAQNSQHKIQAVLDQARFFVEHYPQPSNQDMQSEKDNLIAIWNKAEQALSHTQKLELS